MNTHRETDQPFHSRRAVEGFLNGREGLATGHAAHGKVSQDWRGGTGNSKAGGGTEWGSGGEAGVGVGAVEVEVGVSSYVLTWCCCQSVNAAATLWTCDAGEMRFPRPGGVHVLSIHSCHFSS